MDNSVIIVGGYHDGKEGVVSDDAIAAGFLIESSEQAGEEWWHGYVNRDCERTDDGRWVFRPSGVRK